MNKIIYVIAVVIIAIISLFFIGLELQNQNSTGSSTEVPKNNVIQAVTRPSVVQPPQKNETIIAATGDFKIIRNFDYEKIYCDKISPYDLEVRKAAADATRNHPGSYSIDQLLDIYDWVKQNINYLNVPVEVPITPYPPNETLYTKSGDCKNQAVLIASMVKAIGGSSKVILDPSCNHAYAIVFADYTNQSMQPVADSISLHYNQQLYIQWLTFGDENWLIFDPAGGNYPGNTLPECSGNRTIYEVNSCVAFPGQCIDSTPDGYCSSINQFYYCKNSQLSFDCRKCGCPTGSTCFTDGRCLACPSGTYLGTDGNCYNS